MDELEEFLRTTVAEMTAAGHALHDGDADGWAAIWSSREPVTLFGAFAGARKGRAELDVAFRELAARFRDSESFDVEVVAADVRGDLGYVVSYENSRASFGGGPVSSNRLRVTSIFRREDGRWRLVHRHGERDPAAAGGGPGTT